MKDPAGATWSVTAEATPSRAPVTWDQTLKTGSVGATSGLTEIAARSWTFTISNDVSGIANVEAGGAAASARGGFWVGDLDMELRVTVPSTDSSWIKKRLDSSNGLCDWTTTIDGVAVRWGSCRLAMDQSAMTSSAGYDEVLVFKVGTFKWSTGSQMMSPSPGDDGGQRSARAEPEELVREPYDEDAGLEDDEEADEEARDLTDEGFREEAEDAEQSER